MSTSVSTSDRANDASVVGIDDESTYGSSVSTLAIVSLLLGVVSPVALIAPLLYVIPLAGAALGVTAIGRIAASGGALIGRWAAIIGLALSVACLSAAFTRTEVAEQLLNQQARDEALGWFTKLQAGDIQNAFDQTSASKRTPPPKMPGEPAAPDAKPPIDDFRAEPMIAYLLEHGKAVQVRYVRSELYDPGTRGDARIQQLYEIALDDHAPLPVEVVMQRLPALRTSPGAWQVSGYRCDELSADDASDAHSHDHDHAH